MYIWQNFGIKLHIKIKNNFNFFIYIKQNDTLLNLIGEHKIQLSLIESRQDIEAFFHPYTCFHSIFE